MSFDDPDPKARTALTQWYPGLNVLVSGNNAYLPHGVPIEVDE